MVDIFEWLSREWPHRNEQRTPTLAEDGMSLADIANDIKTHITSADAWLAKVVEEHVPAILAVAEKYQGSPIVQALEGTVLPPEVEQQIAGMITALAKQFPAQQQPAPVPAVPADAEQPTQVIVAKPASKPDSASTGSST